MAVTWLSRIWWQVHWSILNLLSSFLEYVLGITLWPLDRIVIGVGDEGETVTLQVDPARETSQTESWLEPFRHQLQLWHSDRSVTGMGRRFVRECFSDVIRARCALHKELKQNVHIEQVCTEQVTAKI